MKIDIRNVPTTWINLEKHTQNAEDITKMLNEHGFTNHYRTAGVVDTTEGVFQAYNIPKSHFFGVARAQINALESIRDSLPALVLEDDVVISEDYIPEIEIPDQTDAVHLGVSNAGSVFAQDIGNSWARIHGMLAAHGILYVSKRYVDETIRIAKHCIYEMGVPFDLGTAQIQRQHYVIAAHKPFFYQGDERESANKWESLTRQPLKFHPAL